MKLTRRGEVLFIALLLIAGLVGVSVILHLATHIHYVDTEFCYGTFTECFGGNK
jgi:hypothetical protein